MVCLPLLGTLCFSFVYVVLVVPQNRLKYLKPGLLPVLPGSIVDYTKVVYTHLAGAVGLKGLLKKNNRHIYNESRWKRTSHGLQFETNRRHGRRAREFNRDWC